MDRSKAHKLRGADLKPEWRLFVSEHNESAFKSLYSHYYHYFVLIGVKKGFSIQQTQDEINELFLYLWTHIDSLKTVKDHHNYLVTSFLRRLFKEEQTAGEDISALNILPDHLIVPSPEAMHIYNNMSTAATSTLAKHIDKLPERQRLMIYQKFYLGFSYQDIAATNQISINTVYNTVYKAIENLRNAMGDEGALILAVLTGLLLLYLGLS